MIIWNFFKNIKKRFLGKKQKSNELYCGTIDYMYELRDWIPLEKINWYGLSENPRAIYMLEQNPEKIQWKNLSENPNAMQILTLHPYKIDWRALSRNPSATTFLRKNRDKINWYELSKNYSKDAINLIHEFIHDEQKNIDKVCWFNLSKNPEALDLFQEYPNKLDWGFLSMNSSPIAIKILKKNKHRIHWTLLSLNPSAISLLEEYPNMLYMNYIAQNPNAIHLLKFYGIEELDKTIYENLSSNPSEIAYSILEEKQEYIDWYHFSSNPSIFVYNYKRMKSHFYRTYGMELVEIQMHPKNFDKFGEDGWNLF